MRVIGRDASFTEALVSAGSVEIRDSAGGARRRAGPGRQPEQWLIEAGARQLQQDARDAVRQDLARWETVRRRLFGGRP